MRPNKLPFGLTSYLSAKQAAFRPYKLPFGRTNCLSALQATFRPYKLPFGRMAASYSRYFGSLPR